MHDIASVNQPPIGPATLTERLAPPSRDERRGSLPEGQVAGDRLELSGAATPGGTEATGVAEQRIADLRARISAGTYLTPDKLDAVVERLFEEVFRN